MYWKQIFLSQAIGVVLDLKGLSEDPVIKCLFIPANGVFYINYVIAMALTFNALEMFRIVDLLNIGIIACFSRSKAEEKSNRKSAIYPFAYGYRYGHEAELLLNKIKFDHDGSQMFF